MVCYSTAISCVDSLTLSHFQLERRTAPVSILPSMAQKAKLSLLETAEQIHRETTALVARLQAHSIEEPSFEPTCTTQLWANDSSSLETTRNKAVNLSRSLAQALDGPKRYLWEFVGGAHYSQAALSTVLEFKVLEEIPFEGDANVSDLAQKSGLDENKLLRLLRMITCDHVVNEVSAGTFRHTAISALLVRDKHTRALMEMQYVTFLPRTFSLESP